MQINIGLIFLIAIGAMFFGYFFGLMEGRGQGYRKRAQEESKETIAMQPAPAQPAPLTKDDPGLLRLKEENGRLQVDIDGARANRDLLSSEQRKRLIELITRLRPWVETRPVAAAGQPAHVSQGIEPSFHDNPYPAPVPVAAPTVLAAGKELPAAPQTMVTQIDAILQIKIENTPLGQRGIKLEEAPGGAVNVVVGSNRYSGVAEVPDPEVQAVIRAAIAEWERKYTPGM